jgi:hypothetical protein
MAKAKVKMSAIRERLVDQNGGEELMFLDDEKFDKAIVGLCDRFGEPTVVIYDRDKVIEALKEDGMDYEEALEYFEFNIAGAWMGSLTPAFLTVLPL